MAVVVTIGAISRAKLQSNRRQLSSPIMKSWNQDSVFYRPDALSSVVFIVETLQWCHRRIVHIPYTAHITNGEVRRRTGQPPVISVIAKRRLRLFRHLARADPSQDHSRILRAAINRPLAGDHTNSLRAHAASLLTRSVPLSTGQWKCSHSHA